MSPIEEESPILTTGLVWNISPPSAKSYFVKGTTTSRRQSTCTATEGLETQMAWIRTVKEVDASGALKTEYEKAIRRAGRVFEILKIQSLKPEYISPNIAFW